MGVRIRPAHPADVAAMTAIAEAAYAPYVARIGRRPAPMDADYAGHVARAEAFVADEAGAVVGFAVLMSEGDALLLDNIAVAPAAHGRGIGRLLLEFSERTARARGLGAITLYTNAKMTENVALYGRIGYAETERRREKGFERVYMRKELS